MTEPRHDAKYSGNVLLVFSSLATDEQTPMAGPIVDPFAGVGRIDQIGRSDVVGIEIEPEWAESSACVTLGDALDPLSYPYVVGSIMTSPCYGNRFADQYLGPKCKLCEGVGCDECGNGHDGSGRYGYAISLNRRVSDGSAAALHWGPKYRTFHTKFLMVCSEVLEPGQRRLVINISDHQRDKKRQYVVQWWIEAAGLQGFRLVEAHAVDTDRFGHGQNHEARAESEMVLVFDFLSRD